MRLIASPAVGAVPLVTAQNVAIGIIVVVLGGGFLLLALAKAPEMFTDAIDEPGLLLFIPGVAVVVTLLGTAFSGALAMSALVGLCAGVAVYLIALAT